MLCSAQVSLRLFPPRSSSRMRTFCSSLKRLLFISRFGSTTKSTLLTPPIFWSQATCGQTPQRRRAKKEPGSVVRLNRAYNWRRPTLTGPIVPLPSAHKSFTSGFGMGPGGSSLLWPPEVVVRNFLRVTTSKGLSVSEVLLCKSLLVFRIQFSGLRLRMIEIEH